MTLPANGTISMSQVNVELGRAASATDSLNDSWVRALAQVPAGPISMSNLYGKTGRFDGGVPCVNNTGEYDATFSGSPPLFGGTLDQMATDTRLIFVILFFNPNPVIDFTGNFRVTNNTTGIALTFSYSDSQIWIINAAIPANFMRPGFTDNFTIVPST